VRRLVITARAERDLKSALAWLAQRNIRAAREMESDLAADMAAVASHPERWRRTLGAGTRIKSSLKWHKQIVFRVEDEAVVILSIRDTRMKPQGS
jgi:plasmid stabilization system protein ParE